ncbi:helix-turn-helix domain-containing protein [Mesorhizobium sp. M1365]
MSPRSLQRHFQSEAGMSFRAWRQQAKPLKAVEWLAAGRSVGDIAFKSHLRKRNAPDARRLVAHSPALSPQPKMRLAPGFSLPIMRLFEHKPGTYGRFPLIA